VDLISLCAWGTDAERLDQGGSSTRGSRRARRLVTAFAIVVLAFLVAVGMLWAFQRKLIYFPSDGPGDLTAVAPGAEDVTFTTEDGLTLAALLIPARGDAGGVTVVVFNGNAGNRSDRIALAKALAASGYSVLLFDYRGYGGNPGKPSELGLIADGRAAIAYLDSRRDIDGEQLVYFGESLGAAIAIGVAKQRPPFALVLRSPFTSLPDVAAVHYPFLPLSALLWDQYPNEKMIRSIEAPLLVVAGSADGTVPLDQSLRVFDAASDPKKLVVIEGADHNDQNLTAGSQLLEPIVRFIAEQSQP